jgi:membrane protease YdiL (CAAX protease family)
MNPALLRPLAAYGTMALLSLGLIQVLGAGGWSAFGFALPRGPWTRFLAYGLLAGMVSTLAVKAGGSKGMEGALKGISPLQALAIVLSGSAIEELLARGWLQGILEPLRDRAITLAGLSISAPILIGALVFGAMHLGLAAKVDSWALGCLLLFTTTLGLLAGLARERTGSLLPAIAVHLSGNAGGILGGIVFLLIQKGHQAA